MAMQVAAAQSSSRSATPPKKRDAPRTSRSPNDRGKKKQKGWKRRPSQVKQGEEWEEFLLYQETFNPEDWLKVRPHNSSPRD